EHSWQSPVLAHQSGQRPRDAGQARGGGSQRLCRVCTAITVAWEGKYGQAGCGARRIDAALLGRRQRGAASDPALSRLQPDAASTGADVPAVWLQGPSGVAGDEWTGHDLQLRRSVRLSGQTAAAGPTIQRRGDYVGRGPGNPDVLPPPGNAGG